MNALAALDILIHKIFHVQ